jgi:hypothetical protein
MDVVTLSTNLIYKFLKKGGDNLRGTMLLEIFCFVFVPQIGLTRTTIPSNFSTAKQERMKVATTFKWAPHKSDHMPQLWSLKIGPN